MTTARERYPFDPYGIRKLFEVPKGDRLVNGTIKNVRKALETCYPSLENIYSERISANLRLYDPSELQEKIISEIPTQKTATEESLLESGVLKNSIYQERVSEIRPLSLYCNPDATDEISVLNSLFKNFDSNDKKQRIESAIDFGQSLILEIMRSLPIPQELRDKDKAMWKKRAIDHLSVSILIETFGDQPIDLKKLEKLRTNTQKITLKSSKAQFFAYGAEVRVLMPGQKIIYPSYSVGEPLNEGIAEILAEKAQLKFIDLMKQSFPAFGKYSKPHELKNIDRAKKMLEACELGYLMQDEKSLFELYVLSQIPARMFDLHAQETLPSNQLP